MKLRILLLSSEYPPFIFGGIGTFTRNLSEGLAKIGLDVFIFSGYPSSAGKNNGKVLVSKISDHLSVFRFPYPQLPPRHTWFQLNNLPRMYEFAKKIKPDVIHGQSGTTFPASVALKNIAPLLVTFHGCPKVELMMSLYSLRRGGSVGDIWTYCIGYPAYSLTYRQELRSAALSVAVSKSLGNELIDEMGEKYQQRLRVVPNGVNLKQLDSEYGSLDGEEESANNILFAGRLFWRKGAMEIVKLARLMKQKNLNARVVVHGEGPLFGKMKHSIMQFGLENIELRGFTSRSELMRSYRMSKFVIIPSLYEACPLILLESMCLGKIPLMFNLPYSSEFTENGQFGILAENANDLVNKLIVLNKKGDLHTMSNKIRDFARDKYDIQRTASQYSELYRQLVASEVAISNA
jgi:glycosyltransferase involved in cell wall biosynthesis